MSGSTVKNHISLKTGFEYNAIRRTSFRSVFQACELVRPPVLILQPQWHLQDKRIIVLHLRQARLPHRLQQHQATVRLEKGKIWVELIPIQCLCEAQKSKRWQKGRPVVCCQSERSMVNEIDFRTPGLPHAVTKQAENSRVRELVKKIENHPHRKDLQADLQQDNAYNPFGEKSKKMIKSMGNVELFELFDTDPKEQCKECLPYWNQGIVYCTCVHLLREINPAEVSSDGHWIFSQSRRTT